MEKQILTKQSTSEQIKSYFNAVLELSKSDNEYPVNLDEVWMLVYPRKDHAVRELKENFIESVDYQVFLKNGENSNGGRPCNEYHLTISCMEYFITRKVRPVFEAYRRVFHKVSKQHQMLSGAEFLLEQAKLMVEQEKRITNVERRLDAMEQEREESGRLFVIVKTCSDSPFTIGQKNCQMFVAKLHNFLHLHNRMRFYPAHSVLSFPDFAVDIFLPQRSLR